MPNLVPGIHNRVAAVITVHNGERFLVRAIKSVLRQTSNNWQCVIVDDGSTDATPRILKQVGDPRVSVISTSRVGRIEALNVGCRAAQADYIAILDADDAAEPARFELQTAALDALPDIGLVASYVRFRDEATGASRCFRPPLRDAELRHQMARVCPLAHSSVMFRKSLWEAVGGYNARLAYVAGSVDYNLYIDLMGISRVLVLPQVLVTCSLHSQQNYRAKTSERDRARVAARLRLRAVRELRRPMWELVFGVSLWVYSFLSDDGFIASIKRDCVDRTLLRNYWHNE